MLNDKAVIEKQNNLFTDYKPSNSLKYEQSKIYHISNDKFYHSELSRKKLEKRKNAEWNPKIRMYFTNSTLHYNMIIGKHFLCPFQMANQVPGQGRLNRPDLLADLVKRSDQPKNIEICQNLDKFYPKTFRLYNKKECSAFFSQSLTKDYQKSQKQRARYVRKQVYKRKMQKIDFLEDHKLKRNYKSGEDCGQKKQKEIVQTNVPSQLTYEDRRKFKIRAFTHFASFDPLLVYYEEGYVLLEKNFNRENFMDLLVSYEDLATYLFKHVLFFVLIKKQIVTSSYGFVRDITSKIQDIIRKIIFLSQSE